MANHEPKRRAKRHIRCDHHMERKRKHRRINPQNPSHTQRRTSTKSSLSTTTHLTAPLKSPKALQMWRLAKSGKDKPKAYCTEQNSPSFPVIVTIDSDLENTPELIPDLTSKLANTTWLLPHAGRCPESPSVGHPKPWANCSASQIFTPILELTKKKHWRIVCVVAKRLVGNCWLRLRRGAVGWASCSMTLRRGAVVRGLGARLGLIGG